MKRLLVKVSEIMEALMGMPNNPFTVESGLDTGYVLITNDDVLMVLATDFLDWSFMYLQTDTNTPETWFKQLWDNYVYNNIANWSHIAHDLYNSTYNAGEVNIKKTTSIDKQDKLTHGKTDTVTFNNVQNTREYGVDNRPYTQKDGIVTDTGTTYKNRTQSTVEGKYRDTQSGSQTTAASGDDTRTITATENKNFTTEKGYRDSAGNYIKDMTEFRTVYDLAKHIIDEFARCELFLLTDYDRCREVNSGV